jgi:hypothetical protein
MKQTFKHFLYTHRTKEKQVLSFQNLRLLIITPKNMINSRSTTIAIVCLMKPNHTKKNPSTISDEAVVATRRPMKQNNKNKNKTTT